MIVRYIRSAALAASLFAGSAISAVAAYPDKPITIIVPFSPGGAADQAARTLAAAIAPKLGNAQLVIVNKDGAGGIIGASEVYKAKPDGYTLLLARVATHTTVPAVREVPYDPMNWSVLGMLETNPVACAVGKEKPWNSIKDLLATIKEKPGTLTYSSAGPATFLHLAAAMMIYEAKLGDPNQAAIHVPFKGGGPAALAAVKGEVDFVCQSFNEMSVHVRSGALRPLITFSNERLEDAPDAPTAKEAGINGLDIVVGWSGLMGPPGMDPEAVKFWTGILAETKNDKAWQDSVKRAGSVPSIWSSTETTKFLRESLDKTKAVVKEIGIKL